MAKDPGGSHPPAPSGPEWKPVFIAQNEREISLPHDCREDHVVAIERDQRAPDLDGVTPSKRSVEPRDIPLRPKQDANCPAVASPQYQANAGAHSRTAPHTIDRHDHAHDGPDCIDVVKAVIPRSRSPAATSAPPLPRPCLRGSSSADQDSEQDQGSRNSPHKSLHWSAVQSSPRL